MSTVTISPKYQVVIPKETREKFHLKKGQKVEIVIKSGIISIIPNRPLSALKGFVKGMSVRKIREKEDRV